MSESSAIVFQENLRKYIDVIFQIGLNFQPGQRLIIISSAHQTEIAREVTTRAYQLGAKQVFTQLNDDVLSRIRLEHSQEAYLTDHATWFYEGLGQWFEEGAALLSLGAPNPRLMEGIDSKRLSVYLSSASEARKSFSKRVSASVSTWLVVNVPTETWATAVFPDLSNEEGIERLWDAIFQVCRIHEADPVAVWRTHVSQLERRADYLNAKRYTELHYTAPGTDLQVGLPEGNVWIGGFAHSKSSIQFMPNIPTEEVFTLPHRERVNGTITSTLPLSLFGTLVQNMRLELKDGRIVQASADTGEDVLRNVLKTDEGASFFGEVALVPQSSPIAQSGLLFYNTLYDENAASHIAFGNAYRDSLQEGEAMSDDEFKQAGGNVSNTHVDFMIGSAQMDIDGVNANGATEPVMRAGEFTFSV